MVVIFWWMDQAVSLGLFAIFKRLGLEKNYTDVLRFCWSDGSLLGSRDVFCAAKLCQTLAVQCLIVCSVLLDASSVCSMDMFLLWGSFVCLGLVAEISSSKSNAMDWSWFCSPVSYRSSLVWCLGLDSSLDAWKSKLESLCFFVTLVLYCSGNN